MSHPSSPKNWQISRLKMEKGLRERETSLGRKQGGGTKSECPFLHLCLTRSNVWSLATVLSFFPTSLPTFHDSRPLAINYGSNTRFTDKAIGHSLQQLAYQHGTQQKATTSNLSWLSSEDKAVWPCTTPMVTKGPIMSSALGTHILDKDMSS